jgi:hypothetical protein
MAIVAYASAAPNPTIAQVDGIIDLSVPGTLPATLQLYGGVLDSLDPSPTPTWAWAILEKPAGSAVSFADTGTDTSTLQNPVLQDIDTWENIRVMLVVTNTDNGAVSEADRFLAPDTAFVCARLLGADSGLEKLAYGERKYKTQYHELVEAVDTMASTGGVLDPAILQLISSGYAEYPPGTHLHKHKGPDVDVATYGGDQGVVHLSDAPVDPLNPTALTVDYQPQSVQVMGTPTTSGWVQGIEVANTAVGAAKYPHALFVVRGPCTLKALSFIFADYGDATNAYTFEVWYGPSADWYLKAALVKHLPFTTALGPAPVDNTTFGAHSADSALALAAGDLVGVFVASAPTGLTGAKVGNALTVVAHFYREV